MAAVTKIADITITNGSPNVTVNSVEVVTHHVDGDLIYVAGQEPLVISSVSGSTIILKSNAPFTATNTTATIVTSNVQLRDALDTIQSNTDTWNTYFAPWLTWVGSTNATEPLQDSQGNTIQAHTPLAMNASADAIATASADLGALQNDVTTLTNTVDTQQATLDAARNDAVTAKDDAEAAEVRIQTIETNFNTSYASFNARFLGASASDPTQGIDAAPLAEGMSYYNTTVDEWRIYNGSTWDAPVTDSGTNATNAAASAATADTHRINFEKSYLGSYAADPTLDNEGGALASGMMYTNTGTNELRHYNGSTWSEPIVEASGSASAAATSATSSEDAKNISMANANFKGDWSSLTGAANVPYSCKEGNTIYMLLNNVADITLSQPSVDTANWFVIGNITGVDYLPLTGGTLTGDVVLTDNTKFAFGTDSDYKIWGNGADLFIKQMADTGQELFIQNHLGGNLVTLDWGAETFQLKTDMELRLGGTSGTRMRHNGTDGYIEQYVGNLFIRSLSSGNDVYFGAETTGGTYYNAFNTVSDTNVYFQARYNDSSAMFTRSGGITVQNGVNLMDFKHDGTNGILQNNTAGSFYIQNAAEDSDMYFRVKTADANWDLPFVLISGATNNTSHVQLRYGDTEKLRTNSTGIYVSGTIGTDNGDVVTEDYAYSDAGGTPLVTLTGGASKTRRVYWNTHPSVTLDHDTFNVGNEVELVFNNNSGDSTITTNFSSIFLPDGTGAASQTFTGNGVVRLVRRATGFEIISVSS